MPRAARELMAACFVWAILLAGPAARALAVDGGAPRPNVVILLADDLGYGDLGIHGGRDVPTPRIDALAAAGIRCTSGYVSGVYCSPTRAGLLTGRYQQRFGHEFNPHGSDSQILGLPVGLSTIPERLRAAGYRTGLVGKWHLGMVEHFHPTRRGFDDFFGFLMGAHDYYPTAGGERVLAVGGKNALERGTTPEPFEGYLTGVLAEEACRFIDRHRAEPFFLYVAFNAVHTPMQAPPETEARLAAIADLRRRTYAAMLAELDAAVGRVVDQLRAAHVAERTLVAFLSDNGGPIDKYAVNGSTNGPLRGGKGDTWEGGIRVPFLLSWPGTLPAGRTYDEPVIQLDLAATALALAGAAPDEGAPLDGVNLIPHLTGQAAAPPHEALYWRFGPTLAVRMGPWKIVDTWDTTAPVLVNLDDDRGETRDRRGDRPEVYDRLWRAWSAWNAELREPLWPMPEAVSGRSPRKAKQPAAGPSP